MIRYIYLFCIILVFNINNSAKAEINFKPLFDQSDKLFAKKILEIMPSLNKMRLGDENAENIIIEFVDYNCGYCKAIHSELIELSSKKNLNLVIYFYQFPILADSSRIIAKTLLIIAKSDPDKALVIHNDLMNLSGSLTDIKFKEVLEKNKINLESIQKQIDDVDFDEMLEVSYYLAKRIGGSGTPLLIINNFVEQGFLKQDEILKIIEKY